MKLIYIYAAACLLGWGCTTKTPEEKGKQVFLMDSLYENDKETNSQMQQTAPLLQLSPGVPPELVHWDLNRIIKDK